MVTVGGAHAVGVKVTGTVPVKRTSVGNINRIMGQGHGQGHGQGLGLKLQLQLGVGVDLIYQESDLLEAPHLVRE